MTCPFCSAKNARSTGACEVCGGPLTGTKRPISLRPQPPQASPIRVLPVAAPPIAPLPFVVQPPAKLVRPEPVLIARKWLDKKSPRVVAVFCDGESIPLLVLENGALQSWDISGDKWHRFPAQRGFAARRGFAAPDGATSAAVLPSRGVVIIGHESGQVRLRRLEPLGERVGWKSHFLAAMAAHRGRICSVSAATSAAGTRVFSAGSDGTVISTRWPDFRLQNSMKGVCEVVLEGFGALCCLAISPDGRRLALGADDGRVQMWRLEDEKPEFSSAAHLDWSSQKDTSAVKSLSFAPNGNLLVSGNAQGELCLWAAQSGHRLQRLSPRNGGFSPVFAPDSRLLGVADASGQVLLFDAWTGILLHSLAAPERVQTLVFSSANETTNDEATQETRLIVAGAEEVAAWKIGL